MLHDLSTLDFLRPSANGVVCNKNCMGTSEDITEMTLQMFCGDRIARLHKGVNIFLISGNTYSRGEYNCREDWFPRELGWFKDTEDQTILQVDRP